MLLGKRLGRRSRRSVSVLATMLCMSAVVLPGTALAAPPEPSTAELAGLAEDLLTLENAAVLRDDARTKVTAGLNPAVTAAARGKVATRRSLSEDRRFAREAAGAEFDTVTTSVRVESVQGSGTSRTAEIEEVSGHPVAGTKEGTSSTSHHRVSYEWSDGRWAISDITSLDQDSVVSDARVASATRESAEQRRAAIVDRISTIHQGIQRNLPALTAGDEAKLSGKQVETLDAKQPADGGKDVAAPSSLGRTADQPLVAVPHEQVGAQGGEGPPYDYQYMVDVAVYYARDNAVPYVRDTNDCTTFISWVLWNGRYAESGSESLIDAIWNYDDYDVWYYRCNDCSPRKTYTWGGARNWNIYENNYGNRVTFLPYLSDLLISDVFQMDFNGYGDPPNIPDHTTMVTGRGADGWPLLSYHTTDRRNYPMWDTIGSEDGPFWAIRT